MAQDAKELLAPALGPSPFLETVGQMVSRVCGDLGGTSEIVVFNDEAHHCYRDGSPTRGGSRQRR